MTHRITISILFKLSFAILFILSSSFTFQTNTAPSTVSTELSTVVSPPRSKKAKKKTRKKHRKNLKAMNRLSYGIAILLGVLGIIFTLFLGIGAISILGNIVWNLWLSSLLGMIALGVGSILSLVGAIFSLRHASTIDKERRAQSTRRNPSTSSGLSILWGVLLLLLSLVSFFFGIGFIGISFWAGAGFLILGAILILLGILSLVYSIIFFAKPN